MPDFTPDQLWVILPISNPVLWKSRIKLAEDTIRHLLTAGVNVVISECAYGERPHQLAHWAGRDRVTFVPSRAETLVWNKEGLGNVALARLPDHAKYVGWFDADITFRSPSWVADTLNALQIYNAVQPWSDCYDLGPKGEHMDPVHRSFARQWVEGLPIMQGPNAYKSYYKFAHPGYAWAFTRDFLQRVGGLIDTAALGAADHHMAMAIVNRVQDSIPGNLTPGYNAPLYRWQNRAVSEFAGNLGYVPGTIEHGFHGVKASRKYIERWSVLAKHSFDPDIDLVRNIHGLYELAGNKPELRRDLYRYFVQRDEDLNSIG